MTLASVTNYVTSDETKTFGKPKNLLLTTVHSQFMWKQCIYFDFKNCHDAVVMLYKIYAGRLSSDKEWINQQTFTYLLNHRIF